MDPVTRVGRFASDADQYTCVMVDTTLDRGAKKTTGAGVRVLGVLQKDVDGATSSNIVAQSIAIAGFTWIRIGANQTIAVGDPLKALNSSGHAGKAASDTDNVFAIANEAVTTASQTALITCDLTRFASYPNS